MGSGRLDYAGYRLMVRVLARVREQEATGGFECAVCRGEIEVDGACWECGVEEEQDLSTWTSGEGL